MKTLERIVIKLAKQYGAKNMEHAAAGRVVRPVLNAINGITAADPKQFVQQIEAAKVAARNARTHETAVIAWVRPGWGTTTVRAGLTEVWKSLAQAQKLALSDMENAKLKVRQAQATLKFMLNYLS